MKNGTREETARRDGFRSRGYIVVFTACLLALTLLLFRKHQPADSVSSEAGPAPVPPSQTVQADLSAPGKTPPPPTSKAAATQPLLTAKEIVDGKVIQFAKSRRKLAHEMAKHFNKPIPSEFDQFFDAAEAGKYDEMNAIMQSLRKQRESGADSSWYGPQWRALTETMGVADVARAWPPQKLLDYGNSILGALRPGMVYAGGSDDGFYIPTLLNETSDGELRPMLNQSALADRTYLDYLGYVSGGALNPLTDEQSQRAFQDYLTDAQKRFQHDKDFPNEPRQIRPGEDIRSENNRIQVSGQVAVMSINEKLLQNFMQNNPGLSIGMEESFPFRNLYGSATTIGPLMELGPQDPQNSLTAERARQTVDNWRVTAQELVSDPESAGDSGVRNAYSKLVLSQANLFLAHNYAPEAEQAFQVATQIAPANPDVVTGYANMLVDQNRLPDALRVVDNALTLNPVNNRLHELRQNLVKLNAR